MNPEQLKAVAKSQIEQTAKNLTNQDIKSLVDTLSEKDDKLRYNAFLLLQAHSKTQPAVYGYWDVLVEKLDNGNSYQRSIGVMLLAENVRWDTEGKFASGLDKYMRCCLDERFITARQTLQALLVVMESTDRYNSQIGKALEGLDFGKYKENQQGLLRKDRQKAVKMARGK